MRVLLDTSAFLWFICGSKKLSRKAREVMENFDNELVMSVASLWEMAIKANIGKLELSEPFERLIPKEIEKNEIDILQIDMPHLYQMMKLPLHHRDPFDRLIIAQSIVNSFPLSSAIKLLNCIILILYIKTIKAGTKCGRLLCNFIGGLCWNNL